MNRILTGIRTGFFMLYCGIPGISMAQVEFSVPDTVCIRRFDAGGEPVAGCILLLLEFLFR